MYLRKKVLLYWSIPTDRNTPSVKVYKTKETGKNVTREPKKSAERQIKISHVSSTNLKLTTHLHIKS